MANNPFDKVMSEAQDLLDQLTSKENLSKLGEEAAEMVKVRTRLGYGCRDGKKEKLNPLSPGYIKQRKKKNIPSTTTSTKSNLTLTGEMLDSIIYQVDGKELIIKFSNLDSVKKAEWVTLGDRPFMELTKQEVKRVSDFLSDIVTELAKKI